MQTIVVSNLSMEYFLSKFRDLTSSPSECNEYVDILSCFLAGEISNYLRKNQ